jgi:hypothetical protein
VTLRDQIAPFSLNDGHQCACLPCQHFPIQPLQLLLLLLPPPPPLLLLLEPRSVAPPTLRLRL